MKKFTVKHVVSLVVTLLAVCSSYAQLPAFTITATSTPQSCSGNGSISFTTSGTAPGASLDYTLYLLPDTTNYIEVTTTNTFANVVAGNYLIVATQSLGPDSNTSSTTVTVGSLGQQVEFIPVPTAVKCGNDGKLTINVSQGTAISYEIIAGPVIVPPQASNVFENLPAGVYIVRVNDTCGDGPVKTMQVGTINGFLSIGAAVPDGPELPSCNTISIGNPFTTTSGSQIFYPVTMQYTVYPPGGGPAQVITYTLPNGPSGAPGNTGPVFNTIPFYNGQAYSYDLLVTDACGTPFHRYNNQVNVSFDAAATPGTAGCSDNYFTIIPNYFVAPYTVNFTSAPAGFVPGSFNASHPAFNTPQAVYGGEGNSVPEGAYTVVITDACGRTVTETFETSDPDVNAQIIPNVDGCAGEGSIEIGVPGRDVVTIQMTAAPPGYPQPLPQDVSVWINALGGWEMENLPLGPYTFVLVDSCGKTHTVNTVLEPTGGTPEFQVLQRPGCEEGFGSVRIRELNGGFVSVVITSAPSAYPQTLPHNVSANISAGNGFFYMNTLPAGAYTIDILNECGQTASHTFTVEGYQHVNNNIIVEELCGSFNLHLQHSSNGDYLQTYWLQEYDPVTDTWGHPATGVAYIEGSAPLATNSLPLSSTANPNPNNPTLPYMGIFRVIKVFHTYSNGSAANFRCIDVLHSFEFDSTPEITNVYVFPCDGATSEAAVEAVGAAPLTYSIVDPDDDSIVLVDNGTSSLFSGLAPGTYTFRVTDACGARNNWIADVTEFEEMEITAVDLCEGEQGRLSVPQFSFLTYEWYKEDAPGTILSTTNTLSLAPFDSDVHPGSYVVHIVSTAQGSCIDQLISYEVQPNNIPNAGNDNPATVCNEGSQLDLNVYLSTGHQAGGTWADTNGTGALTDNMLNTAGLAAGTYQFTYTVNGDCGLTDDATITITLRNIPGAPVAANVPALCEGGTIQLSVDPVTDAFYQWTGPNNFTSTERTPVITGATPAANGTYNVVVSVNGCTSPPTQVPVSVNEIPDFALSGISEICLGQSGEINVVAENFDPAAATVTYQWYYEGTLQPANTANIVIDQTGTYEVIVTNGICEAAAKQFNVAENTDAFEIVLEDGCRDFDYIISVLNFEDISGAVYEWTGPDGVLAGQTGPEVNISEMAAGTYTVSIENADGCVKEASVDVPNTFCRIPRGISPNVDDLNDKFDLSNLDVQHLQIFNRYGIEVYNKNNYIDEWYGQSDKGDLPSGTYYYVAALSTGRRVTGWVYLQRQN